MTSASEGIVMVGAGGHAKVCIELLQAMGERVAFCVGGDDNGPVCRGVSVLQGDAHLARLLEEGYTRAFIAIGNNRLRLKLGRQAIAMGYSLVNAISPHAIISPSARLGTGIAIMAGAIINAEAELGNLAIINTGASIDHDCVIDAGVHLAPQCALAGNVHVGTGAFLGIGCRVIPEVRIGAGAILGAGSVAICDVPENATAVGVPAKPIKH